MAVALKQRLGGLTRLVHEGRIGRILILGLMTTAAPTLAVGPAAPFVPPRAALAPASAASSSDAAQARFDDSSGALAASGSNQADGLQGVRHAGRNTLVLIDGQWWPVGSQVRGARLISIQRHQATLQQPDGRLVELKLFPGPTKATGAAAKTVTLPLHPQVRTP